VPAAPTAAGLAPAAVRARPPAPARRGVNPLVLAAVALFVIFAGAGVALATGADDALMGAINALIDGHGATGPSIKKWR